MPENGGTAILDVCGVLHERFLLISELGPSIRSCDLPRMLWIANYH